MASFIDQTRIFIMTDSETFFLFQFFPDRQWQFFITNAETFFITNFFETKMFQIGRETLF